MESIFGFNLTIGMVSALFKIYQSPETSNGSIPRKLEQKATII